MPLEALNRAQILQLTLLILAVPVQYFLTTYSTENLRQYEIKKVISSLSDLSGSYLNWTHWWQWCGKIWSHFVGETDGDAPPEDVLRHQHKDGYFATSPDIRSPRPPHVQFRVGQVFKHKLWGYRGVIVGWDETARAPEEWIKKMHPKDKPHWRTMPNYAVLVDTRDRLTPQLAYVVEENIEILSNFKIFHPLVEHYFENFDGAQYLPRPWLKKVFPHD